LPLPKPDVPVRSIAAGECFLDMLGVFAEFETPGRIAGRHVNALCAF
jgi:hypothetical protein